MNTLIIKNVFPIVKNPSINLFCNNHIDFGIYNRYNDETKNLVRDYLSSDSKFLIYHNDKIFISNTIDDPDFDLLGIKSIVDNLKIIYLFDFDYNFRSEKIMNMDVMSNLDTSCTRGIEVLGAHDVAPQILQKTELIPNIINYKSVGTEIKLSKNEFGFTEKFIDEDGNQVDSVTIKKGTQLIHHFSPELNKFSFRDFNNSFSSYYQDLNLSTVTYIVVGIDENTK